MAKRRFVEGFNQKTHDSGSKNFGKIIRPHQIPALNLASQGFPHLHQRNTRMARKASSKPDSGSSQSSATIGPNVFLAAKERWQPSGARQIAKGNPQDERGGVHQFGVPPKGNANFAWVQHFILHLEPHGMGGFVLANGSMSSNQSAEGDIRSALIEADLVDCMVVLAG
jgi:hypothetical protein